MFSPDIFLEKIDGKEGTLFPCPKIKMEIKRFFYGLGNSDMFAENKQSQTKKVHCNTISTFFLHLLNAHSRHNLDQSNQTEPGLIP